MAEAPRAIHRNPQPAPAADPPRWLRLLDAPRWMIALSLLLFGMIYWPTLSTGFLLDDYLFLLDGKDGSLRPPWDYFNFVPGSHPDTMSAIREGQLAWWTSPESRIRFFRPLSSLTFWFDFQVFGFRDIYWHLHSMLWGVLYLLAAAAVFYLVLHRRIAGLALLMLSLSWTLAPSLFWLSQRTYLLTGTFGFATLAFWIVNHRHPTPVRAVAAGIFLLLTMLSGEHGLLAPGGILAWELVHYQGFSRFCRRLLPVVGLLLAWLGFYISAGFGTANSGVYLSPVNDSAEYLSQLVPRLLVLWGSLFGSPVRSISPDAPWLAPAIGTLWMGVTLLLTRRMSQGAPAGGAQSLHWLLVAGMVVMVPLTGTEPIDRVVIPGALFGTGLLAWIVGARFLLPGGHELGRLAGFWAVLILIGNLMMAPLITMGQIRFFNEAQQRFNTATSRNAVLINQSGAKHVVLINGSGSFAGMYQPLRMLAYDETGLRVYFISMSEHDMTLLRSGPDTLDVEIPGHHFIESDGARLLRHAEDNFSVGQHIEAFPFTVSILATKDGQPTRVRFHLPSAADHPDWLFLRWDKDTLHPVGIPAPGESLRVPASEKSF